MVDSTVARARGRGVNHLAFRGVPPLYEEHGAPPTAPPRPPAPPPRAVILRRRTVALGALLGLFAVIVAAAIGEKGSPFQAAIATTLTPAQEAKLPWKQRYTSGSAGPLDAHGLPSPVAQRAAVRRFYRFGLPIWCGGGRGSYATVTFDDGPSAHSEQIMQMLSKAGAQTTYFLIGGSISEFPNVPRQQLRLGGVADHTWTHPDLRTIGTAGATSELKRTKVAIERATGELVTLMRPPYGGRDTSTDRVSHKLGLLPVMWDSDTQDSLGASSQTILQNAVTGLRPGGIVLMHETKDSTVAVLPQVLAEAKKKGLKLVSIPQLLALDPPSLAQLRDGGNGCSERQRYRQQEDATSMRLARDNGAAPGSSAPVDNSSTAG
jgi:peptidoglycan/xylan/chitin deacetylase (PgdA/CDA1 family)